LTGILGIMDEVKKKILNDSSWRIPGSMEIYKYVSFNGGHFETRQ
jgi:hypothetical protein